MITLCGVMISTACEQRERPAVVRVGSCCRPCRTCLLALKREHDLCCIISSNHAVAVAVIVIFIAIFPLYNKVNQVPNEGYSVPGMRDCMQVREHARGPHHTSCLVHTYHVVQYKKECGHIHSIFLGPYILVVSLHARREPQRTTIHSLLNTVFQSR